MAVFPAGYCFGSDLQSYVEVLRVAKSQQFALMMQELKRSIITPIDLSWFDKVLSTFGANLLAC